MDARATTAAAVVEGLSGIEPEWAALAGGLDAPPYAHPGYVRCWLEAYASPDRLVAGTARRDGRLAAVAALVRRGRGLSGMPQAEGVSILGDDPDAAREAVAALLRLPVARAVLRPVVPGDAAHEAIRAGAAATGARVSERIVEHHPVLEISGSWDDYLAGFTSKARSELRRSWRRLAERGEVALDARADRDALDVLDEALALEAAGWKGRGGTALAVAEADGRFFRGLAAWAAAQGWLRLTTLRLDGRAAAFALELEAHGVRYGLKTAYDESLARVSPGRLVIAARVEDAFRSGCTSYDFAGPAGHHTALWTDARRPIAEVTVHPRTRRGDAARLVNAARDRARPLAKRARDAIRRGRRG